MKELLKDHLLRPRLWMAAVFVTVGLFIVAYVANGGQMFSPGELSETARTKTPLGGVASHAELANNCAACHASPLAGQTMADRCLDCHTNVRKQLESHGPVHGRIPENALQCRTCHTEHRGAHANLTSLATFSHDWTAFKLTGRHAQIATDCKSCHTSEVFQGTPQSCVACHAEPAVHKGRFGNNCVQCHTTSTWVLSGDLSKSLASFDHNATRFKLTGKHASADCRQCHLNDTFKAVSTSCVSCHAEPPVHKGRFSNNCAECHTTSTFVLAGDPGKSLANFDHNATGFKLTGKHENVDCRKCHVNNTFKGTAKSCASCHADPVVHKGRFGTACADCHSTNSWTGAIFKHTVFSVNHHGAKNTCSKCHNDQTNFHSYTCYNCHEHTPAKEEKRHARRKIADVANCIKCHGRDKKQRTTAAAPAHDGCPQIAGAGSVGGCPADASTREVGDNSLSFLAVLTGMRREGEAPAEPEPARKNLFSQGYGSAGASPWPGRIADPLARIYLPGSARWDMMK